MQWEMVVALVIAIPVILFPAAFVWYLNLGGAYHALQEALMRRAARARRERELTRISGQPEPATSRKEG